MKNLVFVLLAAVMLTACARDEKDGGGDDTPVCEVDIDVQMVKYPDGTERKSDVERCTYPSGRVCVYFTWVNDPKVSFVECNGSHG